MESGIKGLKWTGIRDHSPGIWNHNAWDRDQQDFSWNQGSNFCGFRDQNSHHFWNEGSNIWVKIWDQLRKNMPRYDPVKRPSSKCNSIVDLKGLSTTSQISFKTGV